MRPTYVDAVKTDVEIAERIVRLRSRANGYSFSPEYGTGGTVGDDGITFIDVEPAQYDDGWDVNRETVSWDDIANYRVVIPELERQVEALEALRRADEEQRKRDLFEKLKSELGE